MNKSVKRRRCGRCGAYFKPQHPKYQYCSACFKSQTPVGWRHSPPYSSLAKSSGGRWRTSSNLRPLIFHSDGTQKQIIAGFQYFLRDVYKNRQEGLSTILLRNGFNSHAIEFIKNSCLQDLLMRFCPKFRDWLNHTVGFRATELLIEFYSLYGDKKVGLKQIAHNLALTDVEHANNLKNWSIMRLRESQNSTAMEKLLTDIATQLLKDKRYDVGQIKEMTAD